MVFIVEVDGLTVRKEEQQSQSSDEMALDARSAAPGEVNCCIGSKNHSGGGGSILAHHNDNQIYGTGVMKVSAEGRDMTFEMTQVCRTGLFPMIVQIHHWKQTPRVATIQITLRIPKI